MHAVEVVAVDAPGLQALPHFGDLALATDHAEIAGVAVVDLLQNMLVVLVAARHEHHVVVVAEIERLTDLVEFHDDGRVGFREAFRVGKSRAVVNHLSPETGQLGGAHQEERHVAAAEDPHGRGRQNGLQKNLQSATGSGGIGLNGEVLALQHVPAALYHEAFESGVAQGADRAAIVGEQELATSLRVVRMVGEDCRQGTAAPGLLEVENGTKHVLTALRQRLRQDFHHAAAVKTALTGVFLRQDEFLDAALAHLHDFAGFRPHVRFQAAAADRADNFPFRRHQHFALFAHRQRPFRRDDRRQRRLLASFKYVDRRLKYVVRHP